MISTASLKAVWNFRGFVLGSVRREFQLRYRGSMLGIAWTVLQPLAMILIYTVIFTQVMKAKLPGVEGTFSYSIYLCAGIIPWGLFAEIIQRSQSVFLDNANLLKKLSFPRLTLPVIVVASALLNFSIIFGLFMLFLLVTGNVPGLSILAMIPLLAIHVLFAVGLGLSSVCSTSSFAMPGSSPACCSSSGSGSRPSFTRRPSCQTGCCPG